MEETFEIRDGILVRYHGTEAEAAVPCGVTEIGEKAFMMCKSLVSVTLPDTLKVIGKAAFFFCEGLVLVDFPPGLTRIGESAFTACTSLRSADIPDSVTEIGDRAFSQCFALVSVRLPAVRRIGESAFKGCRNLASVHIPDSVREIGESAFEMCGSLHSVRIPDGVREIRDSLFSHCKKLASVTLPDSVKEIGDMAFYACESLLSVRIPPHTARIGNRAFNLCTNLVSVFIPESVSEIGNAGDSEEPREIQPGSWDEELNSVFNDCGRLTVVCHEDSCAHRYCLENQLTFLFDYQFEAFHGVIPEGIKKMPSPFQADEEKPYIFISYSHRDRDRVFEIIRDLYEAGWRIWYDEGLTVGDSYDETLESHVQHCAAVLLFVTENAARSAYILENELPWAAQYQKPVIRCVLEEGAGEEIPGDAAAVVSPGETAPALAKICGLTRGEERTAKGISVVVNPADREGADGGEFACGLYASENAAAARTILREAENSGCILYDAAEGLDARHLRDCACLVVFLDRAFLADGQLTGILTKAWMTGKDLAVCQLEDIGDEDLPGELAALHKKQWLNFAHGITSDLNTKLARHLQKRGCRNAAVLPGFEYRKTDEGIEITRYTGMDPGPRIERKYGGIPVTGIGAGAFRNCARLKNLVLPDSVREIGENAFEGCANLTSVVLPKGISELRNEIFLECSGLQSVFIPDNVSAIGEYVFANCEGLASVRLPEGLQQIGEGAFLSCRSMAAVKIPDGVKRIEQSAFSECKSLLSVSLPEGLEFIGDAAFSFCDSLVSVTLPESIEYIGPDAFTGSKNLTAACAPGSYAWRYCIGKKIPLRPENAGGDSINQNRTR